MHFLHFALLRKVLTINCIYTINFKVNTFSVYVTDLQLFYCLANQRPLFHIYILAVVKLTSPPDNPFLQSSLSSVKTATKFLLPSHPALPVTLAFHRSQRSVFLTQYWPGYFNIMHSPILAAF